MCLLSLLILLTGYVHFFAWPVERSQVGLAIEKHMCADAKYFGCISEVCYFSGESGLTLFEATCGFPLEPSTVFFVAAW